MYRSTLESSLEHAAAQLLVAAQTCKGDQAAEMKALAAQLQAATIAVAERPA